MIKIFFASMMMVYMFVSYASAQLKSVEAIKEQSPVTYRIVHPLHEMIATSKEVLFKADIDPAKKEIKNVSAQVDVTTFDSGNSNRDSHAMEVVDAITYPDVSFSSTNIVQSSDSLSVTGKLTFHGVTKDITMLGSSQWTTDSLNVQGKFDITLSGFNLERPSLLMIPVKDTLYFTMKAAFLLH
ncbi:MAG: YceI family protein [Bacteroidota bacterium]